MATVTLQEGGKGFIAPVKTIRFTDSGKHSKKVEMWINEVSLSYLSLNECVELIGALRGAIKEVIDKA